MTRKDGKWMGGGGGTVNCYVYCTSYKSIRNKLLDYAIPEFERKVKQKKCLLLNSNLCTLNKFFEKLNDQ